MLSLSEVPTAPFVLPNFTEKSGPSNRRVLRSTLPILSSATLRRAGCLVDSVTNNGAAEHHTQQRRNEAEDYPILARRRVATRRGRGGEKELLPLEIQIPSTNLE